MEKERTTFVFDSTKLDEYQRGFVSAIMYFITGKPNTTTRWERACDEDFNNVLIKHLDCTVEQGWEITKEIEKLFPGVLIEVS